MNSLHEELLDTHPVAWQQLQFDRKGVPFQPAFDRAIDRAIEGAGVKNPVARDIVKAVVAYLADELREELAKRPPRTWAGKLLRLLFGA